MSRSMCSCGMGMGLERGRGIREEAFRESDRGWRDPFAESVSMWLSVTVSPGVLMSKSFAKVFSPPSSCRIGDSSLLFFLSFSGGISAS